MKKVNKLYFIILFALTALLAVSVFGVSRNKNASADTSSEYRFEVAEYNVVYDVAENCSIKVTEELTIDYKGIKSTGFIRDIPVNKGAQVRNVDVKKVVGAELENVWYDVESEDSDYVSVDIGDKTYKRGKQEKYLLSYTYNITNKIVDKGMLPLNPIGHGWDCIIYNASITIILPDGYKDAVCYVDKAGGTNQHSCFDDKKKTEDGRTVIYDEFEYLPFYTGVTFNINFEDGAIKHFSDPSPYLFVLAGVAVIFLIVLLKLFVFNKNQLMPVVNYEAPNKTDPLMMGKLIDNKVDGEDVTSLIFYWASKGYIKINLEDKKEPSLIRIMQTLPEGSPDYQRIMYDRLFGDRDIVVPSQLKNSFYKTVEQVTGIVNKQTKNLYDKKSVGLSLFFVVFSGLLLGIIPALLGIMNVSTKLFIFAPFIIIIPLMAVYFGAQYVIYNRLKTKKEKFLLIISGLVLASAAICGFYAFLLVPAHIMGAGCAAAICAVSCAAAVCSAVIISRTKDYTEKLNDIIGFKNFIELAEKEQLEMMLEQDPQFYYRILPYAQVLGVTNKWEKKFEDLTVEPPQWLAGNMLTSYLEFRIINGIIRNSLDSFSQQMVSRPSSSGVNGGGRGR